MNWIQALVLAQGLAFEINVPGMRWTRATALIPAARRFGYDGPAKKIKALEWVIACMLDADPTWEPSESMVKALQKSK